jgi:ribonucleoside-diphosphate reductase alpha chain
MAGTKKTKKSSRPPGVKAAPVPKVTAIGPKKEKLPIERVALTKTFKIHSALPPAGLGTVKGYITVGLYEDGRVGEVFIKLDQQGSMVSGMADAWSIAVSNLLQRRVPLSYIVEKFRGMRFEPAGQTNDPDIHFCSSPMDFVARWLEHRFLKAEHVESKRA